MKNLDDWSLVLFPQAVVESDGVDCDFFELKSKTESIISNIFGKSVEVYFQFGDIEFWEKQYSFQDAATGKCQVYYSNYDELINYVNQ